MKAREIWEEGFDIQKRKDRSAIARKHLFFAIQSQYQAIIQNWKKHFLSIFDGKS